MKKDPKGIKDDFHSHCSFKDKLNDQYLEFCTELHAQGKLWPRDTSTQWPNENHFQDYIMQWNKVSLQTADSWNTHTS